MNCLMGMYQADDRPHVCFQCPTNKTTLQTKSKGISSCVGETVNLLSNIFLEDIKRNNVKARI